MGLVSTFVTLRSALGVMVVPTLLVLGVVGSNVVVVALAVLVMLPPAAGAVTVMVYTRLAPLLSVVTVGIVMVVCDPLVPYTGVTATPPSVTLPCAIPTGRVSVTLTLCAALGPLFVTVTVYVSALPA